MKLVWDKYYTGKASHECREMGCFWWRDVMRLSNIYRRVAHYILGDGSIASFWDDLWSDSVLSVQYPKAPFLCHKHIHLGAAANVARGFE